MFIIEMPLSFLRHINLSLHIRCNMKGNDEEFLSVKFFLQPFKPKEKEIQTNKKTGKRSRKTGIVNQMNSSFAKKCSFSYSVLYFSNSIIQYQSKQLKGNYDEQNNALEESRDILILSEGKQTLTVEKDGIYLPLCKHIWVDIK